MLILRAPAICQTILKVTVSLEYGCLSIVFGWLLAKPNPLISINFHIKPNHLPFKFLLHKLKFSHLPFTKSEPNHLN